MRELTVKPIKGQNCSTVWHGERYVGTLWFDYMRDVIIANPPHDEYRGRVFKRTADAMAYLNANSNQL